MSEQILDFTDYAKPIDFKFDGNIYRIPAFNKDKLENLMELNKKFIDIEGVDEEDEVDPSVQVDKTKKYFEMQDVFIATAIVKKSDKKWVSVEASEFNTWPIKVKNRVMKSITEQMATTADEGEPEKKS